MQHPELTVEKQQDSSPNEEAMPSAAAADSRCQGATTGLCRLYRTDVLSASCSFRTSAVKNNGGSSFVFLPCRSLTVTRGSEDKGNRSIVMMAVSSFASTDATATASLGWPGLRKAHPAPS